MKIPAGQSLILDKDLSLTEPLEVEGTLILDPVRNVTITTTRNIIVTGNLVSQPDPAVVHTIRFTDVDENKFQGGGDSPLPDDIGMWVTAAGQLNLVGGQATGLNKDAIIENPGSFETSLKFLTRNLRIEGTTAGQAHVFIKSSRPQTIRYVQFMYMGPRKDANGDGIKELITGRYACHFHHSEDGSRGSLIESCIARDCNNHVFVPHGSHGITMRNNIVYNVTETPFWYDLGHKTNDLLWENNLVVNVKFVERSQDQDNTGAPTFGVNGFLLGFGDGNICRGNVVIGTSGDPRSAGAFAWPEIRDDNDVTRQLESGWLFENNTAINCPSGEQVWQNNLLHHINRNSTIINCQVPYYHGAYQNDYCRIGGMIKGGYVDIRAASATTNRIRFENVTFDADGGDYCVILNEGPLNGAAPILFRNCKFINYKKGAILDQNPGPGLKSVDMIDCNVLPAAVLVTATKSGETIRIQEGNKAWKVTRGGAIEIAKFAPSLWGTGTGLKAEYFSSDFKTKYLERVEPNINLFDLTHPSPHYLVPTTFAARWTGKIQPQFTETYTFYCNAGGGVRLSVNGKTIIDKWAERYPGEIKSATIALQAGQSFDFKLEFFNSDDRSGCTLEWASSSLKREFIPMSQLYPGEVKPPEPPANKPPVADAGADQTVAMTFTLSGKGVDPEGGVLSYAWSQVSGPGCYIADVTKSVTDVAYSGKGEYVFRLVVTDDKGSSGSDEVKVVVT